MASIRKRGSKFQVQIRRNDLAPIARTFHNKQDAQEWARFMETKADRGDLPVSIKELNQYRVADIINRYLKEITPKKLSADNEAYLLIAFSKQPIAKLTLKEIAFSHFIKYRETRLQCVKAGTINRELAIIKHAFDIAKNEWDIPLSCNPLDNIKKLKVTNARSRRLEPIEYLHILRATKHCKNPYISPIIKLAIHTAMRRGEILKIKWEHIDFNKRTLHIPVTKNGHSRDIPLSPSSIRILNSLSPKPTGALFDLTANAFRLSWQRLLKRLSIKDLHFHDLRHEAISRFFERSLSIPEVALISGHRDYRMLFRYTHLKAEDLVRKL